MVLSNNQLYDILELPDVTIENLATVKGFYDDKIQLFGQEVVDIIKDAQIEANSSEERLNATDDHEINR